MKYLLHSFEQRQNYEMRDVTFNYFEMRDVTFNFFHSLQAKTGLRSSYLLIPLLAKTGLQNTCHKFN